jgi:hypothetical protein
MIANAQQMPQLTMGGSKDAEMATPTKALMPPSVTPRPTTKPDAVATTIPARRFMGSPRPVISGVGHWNSRAKKAYLLHVISKHTSSQKCM